MAAGPSPPSTAPPPGAEDPIDPGRMAVPLSSTLAQAGLAAVRDRSQGGTAVAKEGAVRVRKESNVKPTAEKGRSVMRTRLTIMAIVLAATTGAIGIIVLLAIMLGWPGLAIGALGTVAVLVVYRFIIQPWQHRWGAADEEVHRAMPGDDLIPDAASTTRAITIAAPPEQVWPWLVQLGYGRAGWYSYDWIDNDGRPSADRILPKLQRLEVGAQILMLPDMGPRIREIQSDSYFVAGDQEAGIWCLALYPTGDGCRLVSRWRVSWPLTLATAFWILLSDPGAFIMERKMLKGIKARAERAVHARPKPVPAPSPGLHP